MSPQQGGVVPKAAAGIPARDRGLAACQADIQERSWSLPESCQLSRAVSGVRPEEISEGNTPPTSVGNIALNARALKITETFWEILGGKDAKAS